MPTYDYKCHGCGKTFTVVQGIKEDKLTVHEGCGGELERLISGGRLMLPRKSERPGDADFAAGPGEWEGDGDAFDGGMDDMDGMGGMGDMGGMDPMAGMAGMGGMGDLSGMGGMGDLGGMGDEDLGDDP